MRRFKSFFLLLFAFWLPIQAASAAAMPFCRHALEQTGQAEQAVVAHAGAHCHEQAAAPAGDAGKDAGCDNCEMCHLATASYLPVVAGTLPTYAANILVPKLKPASPSHIGDPPQQPPRRLN